MQARPRDDQPRLRDSSTVAVELLSRGVTRNPRNDPISRSKAFGSRFPSSLLAFSVFRYLLSVIRRAAPRRLPVELDFAAARSFCEVARKPSGSISH